MLIKKTQKNDADPNRNVVIPYMHFYIDLYLQSVSWFNQNKTEVTFFILKDLSTEHCSFVVLDKFAAISSKINKTETLGFPQPFVVPKHYCICVIFRDKNAAFGYDHQNGNY